MAEVVAVAVWADTCERWPDGTLVIHSCPTRTVAAEPKDIAPWLDAEEQALMEAVIEAAREVGPSNAFVVPFDELRRRMRMLDAYRRAKKEAPDA